MRAFAMRWIPLAASSTDSPSGSATRRDRLPRRASTEIEIWPSATVPVRHEAEQDVRVGHGRLDAAAAVAGRPRVGAGTARSDLQPAGGVEPRDAAAARADLGDVDRRDPQELARAADQPAPRGHRAADLVLAAAGDRAVLDQRGLRGRAAHVEGDHVPHAELLRHPAGGDDARRRARLEREHRARLGVVGGHDAAGRLHDLERSVEADPVEAGADAVDVRAHQRPHVRVHDRRRRALVLPLLAQDLARTARARVRQLLGEDRAEPLLVPGVEVGVEEADGHGLDAEVAQPSGDLAALRLVERAKQPCRRP